MPVESRAQKRWFDVILHSPPQSQGFRVKSLRAGGGPKKTRRRTDDKDQGGLRRPTRTPNASRRPFRSAISAFDSVWIQEPWLAQGRNFLGPNTDALHIDRGLNFDRDDGSSFSSLPFVRKRVTSPLLAHSASRVYPVDGADARDGSEKHAQTGIEHGIRTRKTVAPWATLVREFFLQIRFRARFLFVTFHVDRFRGTVRADEPI